MREVASVSLKDTHAGEFLSVVPSPGLGLLLHPSEFVSALRYRPGHPIFGSDGPCPAVKAAPGPTKEGQYLLPGEGGKTAEVFIPRHAGGKDCALDVTVVDPLQAALVGQAAC